jgi:hypothetical protein
MIAKQEQNIARLDQYLKAMDMTIYRVILFLILNILER